MTVIRWALYVITGISIVTAFAAESWIVAAIAAAAATGVAWAEGLLTREAWALDEEDW